MYFNNINELSLITNVIFIINELIYVCVYITCVCVYAYIQCNISQEKNKILPFAITWLDVEDIMLSEIS